MSTTGSADRERGPARGAPTLVSDPFRRRRPSRSLWGRVGPVAAVAAGGALGGSARYGVGTAVPHRDGFPWATLLVNVIGSFALAILLVLILDLWPPRRYVRPFVCVGFLGAFTTFSSLAVETDQLATDRSLGLAAAYLALTILLGLSAAAAGLVLGHRVTRRPPPDDSDDADDADGADTDHSDGGRDDHARQGT